MSLIGRVGGLVWEIVSTTVVTCTVPWLSEFVLQRILPLWQRYWPVIYQSVLVPAYHLVSDTIQPLLHDLLSNYGDSSAVSASESPPGGTSPHDQNIHGRASDPVLNPTTSMPSDIEDITRISTSESPTRSEGGTPAEAPKKKVKKTIIPVVEHIHGGMCPADVQKATEKEFEMALQDRVMEETKDKKNAVEAYVYDMRKKLHGKYQEFVTDPEREGLTAKLQEVEDWLYEDGEDETKGVYIAKLEELKKQGDPIEERYKEYTERGPVIDQLVYCINSYRDAVVSNDPKFNHIDLAEKQKVLNECVEAEAWLREKKQHQDSLPKYATPALLSADVRRKAEALDRFARPIMTKPMPAKPATPETPMPAPPQGGGNGTTNTDPNENAGAAGSEAPAADEERYKEYTERGPVIEQLVYCINSYRDAVLSNDPKFNHIDLAEKQKVLNECVEAEAWLREKAQHQDSLPKYATPALLSADVRRKAEALDRLARPIMTKPKPAKPATPETPMPAPPQGGGNGTTNTDPNENAGAASSEAPAADEERYKEYTERGPVIEQLVYCINSYREAVLSNDPEFNHIDLAEKQKVLNECVEAEAWLREKAQHQDSLPKYATPALLSADVRRKAEALDRFARPIMTKPKPVWGGLTCLVTRGRV